MLHVATVLTKQSNVFYPDLALISPQISEDLSHVRRHLRDVGFRLFLVQSLQVQVEISRGCHVWDRPRQGQVAVALLDEALQCLGQDPKVRDIVALQVLAGSVQVHGNLRAYGLRRPQVVCVVNSLLEVFPLIDETFLGRPLQFAEKLLEASLSLPIRWKGAVLAPPKLRCFQQKHHIGHVLVSHVIQRLQVEALGVARQLRPRIADSEVLEDVFWLRFYDAVLSRAYSDETKQTVRSPEYGLDTKAPANVIKLDLIRLGELGRYHEREVLEEVRLPIDQLLRVLCNVPAGNTLVEFLQKPRATFRSRLPETLLVDHEVVSQVTNVNLLPVHDHIRRHASENEVLQRLRARRTCSE
mmetsp:Transcript_6959/g.12774  ORF Transcript_6959/g.12774 Transcript_6959/m.12774 type:complete len:356 (+) Transcript_6959:537-1604(+)